MQGRAVRAKKDFLALCGRRVSLPADLHSYRSDNRQVGGPAVITAEEADEDHAMKQLAEALEVTPRRITVLGRRPGRTRPGRALPSSDRRAQHRRRDHDAGLKAQRLGCQQHQDKVAVAFADLPRRSAVAPGHLTRPDRHLPQATRRPGRRPAPRLRPRPRRRPPARQAPPDRRPPVTRARFPDSGHCRSRPSAPGATPRQRPVANCATVIAAQSDNPPPRTARPKLVSPEETGDSWSGSSLRSGDCPAGDPRVR